MNDLKYSVPSSSTGRRILKIAAVSIGLAVCALVVGAPLGYFEAELSASVDPMRQLLLNEASFGLAYFLCCFVFARKWPDGAAFRSLLAFAVVQLFSVPLAVATGAGFPPRALLVLSIASGAAYSFLGAVAGSWGANRFWIYSGTAFAVCLLSSLVVMGNVSRDPCGVEVVNYDSHSALTQRYHVSIERLSDSGQGGGERSTLVHLFPARAVAVDGGAENTAVFFAITDQSQKLLFSERCAGTIAECSARVVDVARRECESR